MRDQLVKRQIKKTQFGYLSLGSVLSGYYECGVESVPEAQPRSGKCGNGALSKVRDHCVS